MIGPRSRRSILRAGAVGVAVGLAGCFGDYTLDAPDFRLRNFDTESHDFSVEITRQATGETVLDEAVSLPSKTFDRNYPSVFTVDGQYNVAVRVDGGEPVRESVDVQCSDPKYHATVRAEGSAQIGHLGGYCPEH